MLQGRLVSIVAQARARSQFPVSVLIASAAEVLLGGDIYRQLICKRFVSQDADILGLHRTELPFISDDSDHCLSLLQSSR